MTTTFYGATILLSRVPSDERLAEITAEIAEKYFPEEKNCEYQLSDSVPDSVPVLEASHLLTLRKELPEGSMFLLVYPAPERQPTHGKIPR